MRRTFACSMLMVGLAAGAARAQQAPQVDAHFANASIRPGDAAQLEIIAAIGADAPDDAVATADPISIGRSTFVLKITPTSYLFSGACPANRQCFEADINTESRLTPGPRQVSVTVTDSKGRTTTATATVQIAGAPRDIDNDGLPDVWEQEYGLRFYSSEGVDGAAGDPDGDGVSNLDEFRANTNPVERHVRLFAEGSAGAAQPLQSCVTFLPMNPDQASGIPPVHVVFVGDNGRVAYQSFTPGIAPRTLCPLALAVADRVVEIRVESEIELAVERDTSSGPSVNTRYPQLTNTSLGVQEPSRTWIFADGHTGDGIDEFLLLYNPSGAPVTATLTYVRAPSSVVAQASRVLPPGIRTTIWLNQDQPEALGADVSVTIAADAGILAERAFRYQAPGRTVPHDSVSRGAWTTATHWYFPDVDSRGPFASSIVLMNPTTKSTKVTLTSQFPDRAPARLDIALTGGERRELTLRDLPVPGGTTFGVIVDASDGVGIVAERTSSGATSSGGWRRSALGAMQPGTSWILPTTGSLSLDATDLVVLNVSDTPARVRIRMRYDDGFECCELAEATVDVPARGSLHVPMGSNDPARTIRTFSGASLIVDSIPNASGATASIVVERTNYWDIDGVTRSRTNSIIANQVR